MKQWKRTKADIVPESMRCSGCGGWMHHGKCEQRPLPPLRVVIRWRCTAGNRRTCYDCGATITEEIIPRRVPFATQTETHLIIRAEPLCTGCMEREQLNPRYD